MRELPRRIRGLAPVPAGRGALAVALGALTVLCSVGLMAAAGLLISRAAEHPAVLSLTIAIVSVRFFGLARPVLRYLERLVSHDLALRAAGSVRVQVYERVEPLAPAGLESYRRGDLLARFVADVDALRDLYLRGLAPRLVAASAGTVAVAAAALFRPAAAGVLAAGLLVAGIAVPRLAVRLDRNAAALEADARGELTATLVEALRGAGELSVYDRSSEWEGRLRRTDRRLARIARRASLADGTGSGLTLLVTGATVSGVLAVAASAHAAGSLDRVLIALLALLALASFEAVQPLAQDARVFDATLAAGRRVLELTERASRVNDPCEPAPAPKAPFAIAFEGVRARYAPDQPPVLDGFDLHLEPGRTVALVGPSGAGKTTVVNLLVRFLDPERGRVTLGGRDLRDYRQEDVRRLIAVAGQDSHLFSTTIRENVRLGRSGATDDEVEGALRRARVLDWARSLPDGLETLVGEEGRELSGGQRQRLIVARALLANAPVLVLDEPTAHLDSLTAGALLDDILDAGAGRTVLLITHRPEGLDRVDQVVTLRPEG